MGRVRRLRPVPPARLVVTLAAVLLGVVAAAPAAGADVVILSNGDFLVGQLEGAPFAVTTRDGVVQVGAADVREIHLSTFSGDRLQYKNGTVLTGWIDQPGYAVRLPSGQTIAVERSRIMVIRFTAR